MKIVSEGSRNDPVSRTNFNAQNSMNVKSILQLRRKLPQDFAHEEDESMNEMFDERSSEADVESVAT